jgi:bifunctional NMN adenylyltransferase/nudix hydrolase
MKKLKTIVYIGRFSPFHNGHANTIIEAMEQCEQLIIIIGSSDAPRSFKNPWTYEERWQMIRTAITDDLDLRFENIIIKRAVDYKYNDTRWATQIQDIVSQFNSDDKSIGIIGYEKDESSFYIKMFPQWKRVNVPAFESNGKVINGTDIRQVVEEGWDFKKIVDIVPYSVYSFLQQYSTWPARDNLKKERAFINLYKEQFSKCPYPPVFVTADAMVIQSGHVLMVKRKDYPGKGLWALPGGFLNAGTDKSIVDCMIRELKEETKIKLPEAVLRGNIIDEHVFDAIDRSARGRTITHAFYIDLPNSGDFPKIKGSDDAEKAKFIPLREVARNKCFEDHFDIISYFTGI